MSLVCDLLNWSYATSWHAASYIAWYSNSNCAVKIQMPVIIRTVEILWHPARHPRQLFSSPWPFCLLCLPEGQSSETLESLWCYPSKMELKFIFSTTINLSFYGTPSWRQSLISVAWSDSVESCRQDSLAYSFSLNLK